MMDLSVTSPVVMASQGLADVQTQQVVHSKYVQDFINHTSIKLLKMTSPVSLACSENFKEVNVYTRL